MEHETNTIGGEGGTSDAITGLGASRLAIALSYLYMKIFKTELEVNEYDSIYEVIKDVIDEVKGKFRRVVNAIKPCVSIVKSEIESNANRENKDNNMSIMNDEMMRKSYNSVYSAPKYTIELKKNKTYDNERNKDNNIISKYLKIKI